MDRINIYTWGQLAEYMQVTLAELTGDSDFTEEEYGNEMLWRCAGLEELEYDLPELNLIY